MSDATGDPREMPIEQAAARLGLSPAGLRRVMRRSTTITGQKRDGRWYVMLPADLPLAADGASAGRSATVAIYERLGQQQEAEIGRLAEQLAMKDEQLRQANALLSQSAQRPAEPSAAAPGLIANDHLALLLAQFTDVQQALGDLQARLPDPAAAELDALLTGQPSEPVDLDGLRQDIQTLLDRQFEVEKAMRADLAALQSQIAQLRLDLSGQATPPPINLTRQGAGPTASRTANPGATPAPPAPAAPSPAADSLVDLQAQVGQLAALLEQTRADMAAERQRAARPWWRRLLSDE